MIAAIARGEAHIGAGGLLPAAAGRVRPENRRRRRCRRRRPIDGDAAPDVLWTTGFAAVEPVLIYNRDGFRPANWRDLDGETVAYLEDTGFASRNRAMRSAHPGSSVAAAERCRPPPR